MQHPATPAVTPRRARAARAGAPPPPLVNIRAQHHSQCSIAVTISAFTTLLADLNGTWESTAQARDERIAAFRLDWLLGALSRVRPLELLQDGEDESFSDGAGRTSSAASSSVPSLLASSAAGTVAAAAAAARALPPEARDHLLPPDAVERGLLAERTIRRALDRQHQLLLHRDYASLATVARKAMRQTLRTGKPVYIATGMLDAVDFTREFRERGWAAPGVRFGPFRPDLVRFEEVTRSKGEDGERVVSWEVIEIKYSGKTKNLIYTSQKVQAVFYHLNLSRILAPIAHLVPSHKLTLFISHDPLSPAYTEVPLALRTMQATVEHHLFVLLPEWLDAVTEADWQRLQDKLKEAAEPETPVKEGSASLTFLQKLQASAKSAPPTPGRARRHPPSPSKTRAPVREAVLSSPTLPTSLLASAVSPARQLELHDARTPTADKSAFPAHNTLPPLPPPDVREEDELAEFFGRVGID
ncbi:uncharacterized protein JCM10292_005202 [Rhodotorula paludigena]|uniref:uncharacterized protein n=1 Tax=Rhodotorula paludigena TaxID=86838 RepID=UPI0031734E44